MDSLWKSMHVAFARAWVDISEEWMTVPGDAYDSWAMYCGGLEL